MNDNIKNIVFKNNEKLYDTLNDLSQNIKNIKIKKKPFLIEFIGSSSVGKTTTINLINEAFSKNGLKVLVVDEEFVKITKEINNDRNKKMATDSLNYTNIIIEEKISIYDNTYNNDYDIIMYDRGINDEFIWLNIFGATKNDIIKYNDKLSDRNVDLLVIMTCSVITSLSRKYLNTLSVLPSKWTNTETLSKYLESITDFTEYFNMHSREIYKINTDNKNKIISALNIANKIIDSVKQ